MYEHMMEHVVPDLPALSTGAVLTVGWVQDTYAIACLALSGLPFAGR